MRSNFREMVEKLSQPRQMNTEKTLSMVNDGILILYALFIVEDFLDVTTFHINWPEYFHQTLIVLALILLAIKLACSRSFSFIELLIMGLLIYSFLKAQIVSGYSLLGDILIFILLMKDIPFKRIVKVYFTTVSFLLIVTFLASQAGIIENLVYHFTDRGNRHAFGVCYPTDFAAFIVWLSLSWIYIRKENMKFIEIIAMFLATLGVWRYCGARLSAAILTVSVLLFSGVKLRQIYVHKKRPLSKKIVPEWMQNVMALATLLCASAFITLSYFYSENQTILVKLNSLLSGRLALGRLAFEKYNIELFGQFIPMTGFGKSSLIQLRSPQYFFIDSSFVSILMCYGFLVFVCIILGFTCSAFRAKQNNDYYLVLLIALIAVDCMVEHHMMEICYNPFLFLMLSDIGTKTAGSKRKRAISDGVAY